MINSDHAVSALEYMLYKKQQSNFSHHEVHEGHEEKVKTKAQTVQYSLNFQW